LFHQLGIMRFGRVVLLPPYTLMSGQSVDSVAKRINGFFRSMPLQPSVR
jgi:hypothetical protein